MTVHRAKLSRFKKRTGTYTINAHHKNRKQCTQTEHIIKSPAVVSKTALEPPSIDDPIYQTYLNLRNKQSPLVVRPQTLKPLKTDPILKSNPSSKIIRLIKSGEVWDCSLHKIFISQMQHRYAQYPNVDDVLPVVVYMGRLRDTLIPFHEPCDNPGVEIKNTVEFLSEYSCFIDKESNMRMFYKDGQRYMRIGDVVSDRCIVRCIELSSYGANCVFNFWVCCDYGRFLFKKKYAA